MPTAAGSNGAVTRLGLGLLRGASGVKRGKGGGGAGAGGRGIRMHGVPQSWERGLKVGYLLYATQTPRARGSADSCGFALLVVMAFPETRICNGRLQVELERRVWCRKCICELGQQACIK